MFGGQGRRGVGLRRDTSAGEGAETRFHPLLFGLTFEGFNILMFIVVLQAKLDLESRHSSTPSLRPI